MSHARRPGRFLIVFAWLPVIVIASTAVPVAQATDDGPDQFAKLGRQLRAAYGSAEYQKALGIAEEMHALQPRHVGTLYNIACLHCLLGHKEKAYASIEKAVDAGYDDADFLADDDDFKTIRGEDRFRAIVKRLRAGEVAAPKKADKKAEGKQSDKPQETGKAKKQSEPKKPVPPKKSTKPKKPDIPKLSPEEHLAKFQELTRALVRASQGGQHEKALELALEALDHGVALHRALGERAAPAVSQGEYNVACMYSLLNRKDKAFEYLHRAVKRGTFPGDIISYLNDDSDLQNIRKDPRFARALEMARTPKGGAVAPEGKRSPFKWKVTVPEGHDREKKAPLLVALHSYGGSVKTATQLWQEAAGKVGALLLTPQGTVGIEDGRFEWGGNLDRIEADILDAINEVLDTHKIDQDKIVLAGFSQGGWATWSLALRNPDTFRGIIPVAGRFAPASDSYLQDEDLAKLRVFIMVGADENEQILRSNKQAAERLEKAGSRVQLNIYDRLGHAFPKNAVREQVKALRFVLGD